MAMALQGEDEGIENSCGELSTLTTQNHQKSRTFRLFDRLIR
ncbi:MAG: hypothetical protein Q3W91_04030 [Senegalimassilia sp.]|nr:hypothetical protein [Senegalimassilia sp.]MDR4054081.1 hypothetical protein [Senegalimassilia sp.]